MDSDFFSHLVLGFIGALAALGAIGTVLAFWSLGRQGGYRD